MTYPDLQVLVCDDGSTDRTLEIARRSPFEVLALPHGGLSAARNAGLAAARGEIVAYLDADAACHPEWPFHLALAFEDPRVVVAGGPNLPWPDAGLVERAVALSPGNPVEVLVGDDRAEHVPGLQPGGPAVRAGGDRRLRRRLHDGRRRRGRLLAADGPGRSHRLLAGRAGAPPPPRHGARLPAPAARLRPGRADAVRAAPAPLQPAGCGPLVGLRVRRPADPAHACCGRSSTTARWGRRRSRPRCVTGPRRRRCGPRP